MAFKWKTLKQKSRKNKDIKLIIYADILLNTNVRILGHSECSNQFKWLRRSKKYNVSNLNWARILNLSKKNLIIYFLLWISRHFYFWSLASLGQVSLYFESDGMVQVGRCYLLWNQNKIWQCPELSVEFLWKITTAVSMFIHSFIQPKQFLKNMVHMSQTFFGTNKQTKNWMLLSFRKKIN